MSDRNLINERERERELDLELEQGQENVAMTENAGVKRERPQLSKEERARRKEAAMRAAGTWREPIPRSEAEMAELFPRYPAEGDADDADDTAWRHAYAWDDAEGIADALDRYGVAVIDAVPEETARATAEAALAEASDLANPRRATARLSLDDPNTWVRGNWPSRSKFLFSEPAFAREAFALRAHPHIRAVFSSLYPEGTPMWSSIDNWGVMRGTRGLTMTDPETGEEQTDVEMVKWRTSLRPHWDCNPHRELSIDRAAGAPQRYQGLVALVDCPVSTGTFAVVPGSSNFVEQWITEHFAEHKRRGSYRPDPSDPMLAYMQPIPLRAGQMVIWKVEALHANVPNTDASMRVVQFIRHMPAVEIMRHMDRHSPLRVWKDYPDVRVFVDGEYDLTPDERLLFGLDAYDDASE